MSISLMTVAWKLSDLSMAQKFVLVALCDSANDDGMCFPSNAAIARKCNLTDRGVRKITAELETMGYLRKKLRTGHSTVYIVTPELGKPRNNIPPGTTFPPEPRSSTPEPRSSTPELHSGTPEPCSSITQIETKITQIEPTSFNAREDLPEVPINPTQWAAFFVNVYGFAIHEAQTARSIPMFADWVKRGIAVADVEMAIVAGNAWLKGQGHTGPPHNVCLYGGFLETVLANKRKRHATSTQTKSASRQIDPSFAEKYPHLV